MFALHVAEDNSDGYLSDEEPESTQGMDHLKLEINIKYCSRKGMEVSG